MEYWHYLESRFFAKLEQGFFETIRKLELSIKKYYVVNCIQTTKIERCREFFEQNANELAKDKEWRDWFGKTVTKHSNTIVLPFIKNPELQPELEPYFNKTWAEMLYVSLQNFIATALQNVERPQLLTLESDKRDRNSQLRKKLDLLLHENESLNSKLLATESYILKLESEGGTEKEKLNVSSIEKDLQANTNLTASLLQNIDDNHFDYEANDRKRGSTTLQLSQTKHISPKVSEFKFTNIVRKHFLVIKM
jgi:hypothetical protein